VTLYWADAGQPDVTATFLQYGVVGAVAVLGLWFYFVVYKDLKAQRDACQQQVKLERDEAQAREERLQQKYEQVLSTILPLVTEANRVNAEAMVEVRRIREVR
jgi:hypothetical protein